MRFNMSCDKRCFEYANMWFGHSNCSTCPGQDNGNSLGMKVARHNHLMKWCAARNMHHSLNDWPHEPDPESPDYDEAI